MKQQNQTENLIKERGRSMVEMLGVLAIIGVLSIGGIAGYTMAMNRYKANVILDQISKVSLLLRSTLIANPNINNTALSQQMKNTVQDTMGNSFTDIYCGHPTYDKLGCVAFNGGRLETTFSFHYNGDVSMLTLSNNKVHASIESIIGKSPDSSNRLTLIEGD